MILVFPSLLLLASPAGPHCGLKPVDHRDCPTFAAGEPIVGTYFFYWYHDGTREHFLNADGSDALTTHPLRDEGRPYRYDAPEWWAEQIADVRAAGIDFIAPVYWGVPGMESWSTAGLRALAELVAEQQRNGHPVMPVAMFYDTSTLQYANGGRHIALDTAEGKTWFYETVRDFFSLLPPAAWARIEGRPIVILYSPAFAKTQDPTLFGDMKRRFQADFGVEPHLIKHTGWEGEADGVITWGGALGLKVDTAAAVGPGYDHSAVPGRQPLIVDRRGGDFYRENWERLLARSVETRPKLVMVETWNEFHEGTDVAPSVEYGRLYVELTAHYAALWHAGERLPRSGRFADAKLLHLVAGREPTEGLRASAVADGPFEPAERDGRACLVTLPNPHGAVRYLYLDIDNSFTYDEPAPPVRITITFRDAGCQAFELHYDSLDEDGSVRAGAFKPGRRVELGGTNTWRRETFVVTDGRFGDRTNGSDFRFAVFGGELAVAEVTVEPLRESQE